jgi:hypothetical protein
MPISPQGQQLVNRRVDPSMSAEQIRDMRRIFSLFDKALDGYKHIVVVPPDIRDDAARHAIRYHLAHLSIFNIEQTKVDPYKAATWYGYFIWERIRDKDRISLVVAIYVLNYLLGKEPKKVKSDETTIKQIVAFAKNHEGSARTSTHADIAQDSSGQEVGQNRDGDEDHAIGKVGIYTTFTAARRVLEIYNPHQGR